MINKAWVRLNKGSWSTVGNESQAGARNKYVKNRQGLNISMKIYQVSIKVIYTFNI